MRTLTIALVALLGVSVACDDGVTTPATTGQIALHITVLPRPEPPSAPATSPPPVVTAPATETSGAGTPIVGLPHQRTEPAPASRSKRLESSRSLTSSVTTAPPPPASPSSATSSRGPELDLSAFDAVNAIVDGPTKKTVALTAVTGGFQATVANLTPGTYSVTVEGITGGEVDYFGATSGITVVAGDTASGRVTLASFQPAVATLGAPSTRMAFTVSFTAVASATAYDVEWATNSSFTGSTKIHLTTTSTTVNVADTGTYYVRVRASNTVVTSGRASAVQTYTVLPDQTPTGADAATAPTQGFLAGAGTPLTELNIAPASDSDWFAFTACQGDTAVIETKAARLSPASALNTMVSLWDSAGTTEIDSNDDGTAIAPDSHLSTELPSDGRYAVLVHGVGGTTGNYEITIGVAPRGNNTGTACASDSVASLVVTGPSDTVHSVTATRQFTAALTNPGGFPITTLTPTWVSRSPSVATVDGTGLVTSAGDGSTWIVASAGGQADSAKVVVQQVVARLAFTTLPSATDPRAAFTVAVTVQDSLGSPVSAPHDVTVRLGSDPTGMVFHASGINVGTPVLELVDPMTPYTLPALPNVQSSEVGALVYDSASGKVFGSLFNTNQFTSYDVQSGAETIIGTPGVYFHGLAFDAGTGTLLGGSGGSPDLYSIDTATGAATDLGTITGLAVGGINGLATDPTSGTMYAVLNVTGFGGNGVRTLATLNPSTLVATAVGQLSQNGVAGLAFLHDGTLLAVTGDGAPYPERLWTVDKTSGAMTVRAGLGDGDDGEAIAVVPTSLTGTLTQATSGGVATFSDLQINGPANGYTLIASIPSGFVDTSTAFDVNVGTYVPGPAAQLAFTTVPGSSDPNTPFTVAVEVEDAIGTPLPGASANVTLTLGQQPGDILFRASDEFPITFTHIDPGSPANLGPLGFMPDSNETTALTYDAATGMVLAGDRIPHVLSAIDPQTGNVTVLGTIGYRVKGLAFDTTGTLIGVDQATNTVLSIDASTGAATVLGAATGPTIAGFNGLATDPTTGTMYAVANPGGPGNTTRDLITLDPVSLSATTIGTLPVDGVAALAFLHDGTLLALTGTSGPHPRTVYTVDKATADMTIVIPLTDNGTNPFGETMTRIPPHFSGTLTQATSGGVATFSDLQIDAAGTGYTVVARAPGLSTQFPRTFSVQSASFTVNTSAYTPGPPYSTTLSSQLDTLVSRGDQIQLMTTGTVDALGVPTTGTFSWFSRDANVASVDGTGLVTAQNGGSTYVVGYANNGQAADSAQIVVLPLIFGTTDSAGGASDLYLIDRNTGATTLVGAIGFDRVGAIDFDPTTGILYGAAQRTSDATPVLITINTTTGAGTEVGATGVGDGSISDLSFRSDGVLYAFDANPGNHRLFTINTATGAATLVGTPGLSGGGNALAFDASDVLNLATSTTYTLDQSTGAATAGVTLTFPMACGSATVPAADLDAFSGTVLAAIKCNFTGSGSPGQLGTIDFTTGTVTTVGTATITGLDGLAVQSP